jgi:N4-gp56 family major capsid protein
MSTTRIQANLTPEVWDSQFYREYGRNNRFARYMANNANAVCHVREDLTREPGEKITFPLVRKLSGPGVTGEATLEGNEEALDNRSAFVVVDYARHAVKTNKKQEQLSSISLREAMKWGLREWINDRMIDKFILDGLHAIPTTDGNQVRYSAATEGQKDTWLTSNNDRILFGNADANTVAGDHSASLANMDTTNDLLTSRMVTAMKDKAKLATHKIRPLRMDEGDEKFFVMFAGTRAMRNLKQDTAIINARQYAEDRGSDNPLFVGGDILWDNVLIHEVEDISSLCTLTGVGASTANVEPVFLCGAQAVTYGVAQRTRTVEDRRDYDFVGGLAIEIMDGLKKTTFGVGANDRDTLVQHGIVTGYVAVT